MSLYEILETDESVEAEHYATTLAEIVKNVDGGIHPPRLHAPVLPHTNERPVSIVIADAARERVRAAVDEHAHKLLDGRFECLNKLTAKEKADRLYSDAETVFSYIEVERCYSAEALEAAEVQREQAEQRARVAAEAAEKAAKEEQDARSVALACQQKVSRLLEERESIGRFIAANALLEPVRDSIKYFTKGECDEFTQTEAD